MKKIILLTTLLCFALVINVFAQTWTEQTSSLTTELNSVSAVNDMVCWASGAAGKVVRTLNSGVVWTNVSGDLPIDNPAYVIWGFDANNAVVTTSPASGAGARIFKTTNGGTNWVQKLYQADGWGDGFYFLNASTGFFYGDHTGTRITIFKTIDGGNTWDSTGQYFGTTADGWNNAMFGLGNQIWIGTNSTTIVYSSNAGVNWVAQTTSAANQYAIWFNSATVGMAGGPSTATWKTTNSGTNWAVINDSIANNCTGLCGMGTSWWQTTFLPNVYYSSNDGATWSTQYIAPAGNFRHITKARTGTTIWGVRSNGGISRYGTSTSISQIGNVVPSNYSLSQNFPNPFNPVTNIYFALPKSGMVTLKVFDALGKEVATLVNEVKNAGTFNVDFNGATLSSGIYFYKLESGDFSSVKKMMLVK
ncbi:MAG: T9SS type A sorting domain-containing protein [Ignavibacteriae bacterium]|nr:T9SS type A sorting domain-containing protein [Ignavibacteriota bacterium]